MTEPRTAQNPSLNSGQSPQNSAGRYTYRVPSEHPASGVQYLLDGRQRMTTLYGALAASFWTRDGQTPPSPDAEHNTSPDGTPWTIFYDLSNESFIFKPRSGSEVLLPLGVLLDDNAYDDWRNAAQLSREHANRARAIRSAFMDYQIPLVPLAVDDISIVTLTFKRVNNGGTPMSDADMARALAWSEGFDLRVHINSAREHLAPSGWGGLEDDPLLKVVAAVCDVEPIEVDPEKLAREIKQNPAAVRKAGEFVVSAAAVLRAGVGIFGPKSLPYEQILVFAARAFHEGSGTLTQEQQDELTAWVAEVCLDERFGGAPPHVVRAEWRTFARRLGLPNAEPAVSKRDERVPQAKECWKFGLSWARSLGTGLVLADRAPRAGDGTRIENAHACVATGSENVGMLLTVSGEGLPPATTSAVKQLRGAALRSPANRVICPQSQLPALRASLLRPDCSEEILASHIIGAKAHEALRRSELEGFFEQRRQDIWVAEQRWVDARGGKLGFQADPRRYAQG